MFFPPCPQCEKNTVVSAEDDRPDHNARGLKMHLTAQAISGHPHPVQKAVVSAILLGRAVYKRWPGGGLKQCTACGFEFR